MKLKQTVKTATATETASDRAAMAVAARAKREAGNVTVKFDGFNDTMAVPVLDDAQPVDDRQAIWGCDGHGGVTEIGFVS